MQDIPLIPSNAWYDLTVPVEEFDGSIVTMRFEIRWNFRNRSWYFTLFEDDNTLLISGVRMVLGTYLGSRCRAKFFRDGVLVMVDTSGKGVEAGFDDLGTRIVMRRFTVYEVMVGRGIALGRPV